MSSDIMNFNGTVLVTGATGLVGKRLCEKLCELNYKVMILSRKNGNDSKYSYYKWDIDKKFTDVSLSNENIDYIIHLAGSPIAEKKWTKKRKTEIISSRVDSTKLLERFISKNGITPKAFISASAIGIYGNRPDNNSLSEDNTNDNSDEFLVKSCVEWEKSAEGIKKMGIRTVQVRIGIVLSTKGGALAKMLPTYKFGFGTYFGNGKQIFSWIHIDDLCDAFIFLMKNKDANGPFNAVSPHPVNNKTLAANISKANGKKAFLFSVPAAVLKLALGEMSAIVLDSANVSSKKLSNLGFSFQYPDNIAALKDLFMREI